MAHSTTNREMQRRRSSPLIAGVSGSISILLVVALWILFAPVTVGGKFSYFFVTGNSMEPRITADDLVLLRAADRYDVGDVIGYRDPILGMLIHRVRALDGDRYIMRGDNRDSDDPYRPLDSEVLGREWHVFDNVAAAVRTFQSPRTAVALTILTVAFGVIAMKPKTASGRTRKTSARRAPAWMGQIVFRSAAGDSLATLSSTLLFTAVGLAGVMVWNGAERVVTKDIVLEQSGTLDYTANAGTGLYDGDEVATGQPIFTQIGTLMPVSFTYEIAPISKEAAVHSVRGVARLVVELSQENDWTREFEVLSPTAFVGTVATAEGTIDLRALQDTADRMEQATLLKFPLYSVRVIAEVTATGEIAGKAQDLTYRTEYPFQLQELQLVPGQKFNAVSKVPLNVKRDSIEPWSTSLPLVGTRIDYTTLQALTLVLGVAGAGALGLVYVCTLLAARGGETSLILARYAPLLVSVQATDVDFGGRIVAVKKFEDLARMARADGLFIVHAENGVADHFLLVTSEVTYLYSVPRAETTMPDDAADASRPGDRDGGPTRSGTPTLPGTGGEAASTR